MYLVEPLNKLKISQEFGKDFIWNGKSFYQQFGMKGHNGLDVSASVGTPIYAMADGKIGEIVYDNGGYGYHIREWIEGVGEVVYAHLSKISVKVGDIVKVGQEIALSGNTGASTGPHLHIGFRPMGFDYNNGYKGYIDPKPYLISKQTYMEALDRITKLENEDLSKDKRLKLAEEEIKKIKEIINKLTWKSDMVRRFKKLGNKFIKKE